MTMIMMIMMIMMKMMMMTTMLMMVMTMTMMMMMRNDPEIGSVIGWHTQPLNNFAVPGQKISKCKIFNDLFKIHSSPLL